MVSSIESFSFQDHTPIQMFLLLAAFTQTLPRLHKLAQLGSHAIQMSFLLATFTQTLPRLHELTNPTILAATN